MPLEVYADLGSATVSSGGTTAPSAGTSQSWTLSGSTLPACSSSTTPPTHFYARDPASTSEIFEFTACAGTSATVTRGVLGTAPVTHASGFTVEQIITDTSLGSYPQWYNVRSAVNGAVGDGSTDDTAAIQNALTLCRMAGGGIVYVPEGVYLVSSTLQAGSNTTVLGAGGGVTTIKMKSGSWSSATQNGSNGGISCLQAYGSTSSNITVRGITWDGNETGVTAIPSWADASECSPLALRGTANVTVDNCQVINSIGYSLYLWNCTDFTVSNNRVTSGQVSAAQGWGTPAGQDGIHVSASQYGDVTDNIIATGNSTAGDDAIALQSWGTGANAIVGVSVTGNIITASAQSGIDLALSGGPISSVAITGNTISNTQADGLILQPFSYAAATLTTGVTISGNTFANVGLGGTGYNGITAVGYASNSLGTGNGWADLIITGNTFVGFDNSGQLGMFLTEGSGLQINQNAVDQWIATNGIQVGDSAGPTSVTNFQVSGNTVNMTAGTDTGGNGILVQESQNGTVSGNVLDGPTPNASGSAGINIGAGTTACTGIVVTGNRITGWDYGCSEYNGGVASDYNQFTGNIVHGCTTPISISGPHTLYQPAVTDVGGIIDSEQFVALSSSYTLTSSTSAQKLFNATTSGTLTVAATTTYFFECEFDLTGLYTSTANAQSFGFGGTASFTALKYHAQSAAAAAGTLSTDSSIVVTSATATALTATSTTGAVRTKIRGVLRINAGGTIIPQITLGHAIAAVVSANSWFRIWPAGSNAVTNAGNWS